MITQEEISRLYKLTDKSLNDSFLKNLKFWESGVPDVYITDFDLTNSTGGDTKEKDMICVFKKGKSPYLINIKMIKDKEFIRDYFSKL